MADPLDLDALEALAAEALEHGPWRIRNDDRGDGWVVAIEPEGGVRGVTFWAEHADDAGLDVLPDDGRYIVAACNSVPALVAEVRRLRAEINTLQANKEECDELASEEIARLRAKAARDAEALDALTTWVYEQAGEWSGWTDKMAAHRLVLLLRKTGREPLGGPP